MIINKRLLSAFMVICMILALLPMNSKRTLAEEAPVEYYELWVGGVQVTSKNKDNITGPGISGSVSYIPETQTLAVSSAAITGVYSGVTLDGWPFKSAIYATGPLKIVLTGNNTMSVVSEKNFDNYGIYSLGNITIYGTGSLDVNNYINEVYAPISIAIHSEGNITIDSGTVTASSSNAEFKSSAIGGNEVKISGGTVKVTARSGINGSIGIYGDSGVTIEGGLVEATADTKYDSSYVYGIAAGYKEVIIISGGNVTASSKATTGTNGAIDGDFKPSNGTISASTNSDGTEADIYDPAQLKNYKYIHYEVNPDIALVAAKEAIEGGSYTMTQAVANTEAGVKAELARQMNGLSGMSGTGITVADGDVTVTSFTPAVAGTSANPVGTNGSISFTVALSKGTVTDITTSLTGVITATAYRPIEPPIQPPVQPPISVPISPTPTPTPAPKVSLKITEDNIQVEVELTSDVIEYYDGQITLPIASEEILNELEKDELSGVRVGLNLPEQSDDADQQEINFILESEVLQKAKENNKDITVDVKDSTNKVLYSWTFDKAELSNSDKEVKDVNLSLKVEKASEDAHLLDAQKDNKDSVALVIGFAHEGLLPSQASVKIYVGNQEGIIPGTKVYLYHYNENIGKLETIPYGYQATVDEAGYITINILQCSDYVVFTKEADSKQFVSLRNQIKVTPTKISLSLTEGKNSSKITVKLPVTLEWVRSLNEPTSQSAIGGVTIKFTSSDNQIAKVDSQGNITAKSPGEVVIKTTITLYNKKTKKIELLVKVKP